MKSAGGRLVALQAHLIIYHTPLVQVVSISLARVVHLVSLVSMVYVVLVVWVVSNNLAYAAHLVYVVLVAQRLHWVK